MFHTIAAFIALSAAQAQVAVPRQPSIVAFSIAGGLIYYSRNAHTVGLDGAEVPLWGFLRLPAGTYTLTAYGDRGLTETITVHIY